MQMRLRNLMSALMLVSTAAVSTFVIGQPTSAAAQGAGGRALSPAEGRERDARIADLSRRLGVREATLQQIARMLGSDLGSITFDEMLARLDRQARDAADLQRRLAVLQRDVQRLTSVAVRTPAEQALDRATAAFETGRLDQASRELEGLEVLRRLQSVEERELWLESIRLQAELARLRQDFVGERALLDRAEREIDARHRRELYVVRMERGDSFQAEGDLRGDNSRLRRAVLIYRNDVLPITDREAAPLDWARAQNELGITLSLLGWREDDPVLQREAIAAYQEAAGAYGRGGGLVEAAAIWNNLGNAMHALGRQTRDPVPLSEAARFYERALEVRTYEASPYDWAVTMNGLGNTEITIGHHEANPAVASGVYRRAMERFQLILSRMAKNDGPELWATANTNLGRAAYQRALITHDITTTDTSRRAFLNALEVRRAGGDLPAWQESESGLAQTLLLLNAVDPGKGWLNDAIASFRTLVRAPGIDGREEAKAQTRQQLSAALILAGEGGGDTALFREARDVLDEALRFRTADRFPVEWAESYTYRAVAEGNLAAREGRVAQIDYMGLRRARAIAVARAPRLLRLIDLVLTTEPGS